MNTPHHAFNGADGAALAPDAALDLLLLARPLRTSAHRPQPLDIPADSLEASAVVASYIRTSDDAVDRAAAVEASMLMLARLKDVESDAGLDIIRSQLEPLHAAFVRYMAAAVSAKQADHSAKFMKIALACQLAFTRSLALVEGLQQQRKGKALVNVIDNDGDDS